MPESFEIALLLPHFNNRAGMESSLQSVRYSGKLVIVLVDDGSNVNNLPDVTWVDRQQRALGYPIRLLTLGVNCGIEEALNKGLTYIRSHLDTKYVARLDCGDRNHPDRLDLQVAYFESHPNVSLVGTWAEVVKGGRPRYILRMPVSHDRIVRRMHYNNSFIHPTVMFRTHCLDHTGLYPLEYPAAEDYAFFLEFSRRYKTANLAQILVSVSMEEHNISSRQRRLQLRSRLRIIRDNFRFHPYWLWGVLRTWLLMVIPFRIVENFKQIAFNEDSSHH
jgi:glycosyltransferase involved in cell wall biosynthesis